jgi:integrase
VHPDTLRYKTNRAKRAIRKKPYKLLLAPGIHLAYRRCEGPGTWSVHAAFGLRRFALADDREAANGISVMTYDQASKHAIKLVRGGEGNADAPTTVAMALDAYEVDLEVRGRSVHNARMVRIHMDDAWLAKVVALLTRAQLAAWRNTLVKDAGLKPASANRIWKSLSAALTLAAQADTRITNHLEWTDLPTLSAAAGNNPPRDKYYRSDADINLVKRNCYALHGEDYGDLIETLAAIGTRESQCYRLWPHDLQESAKGARLMVWTSNKGGGKKVRTPEQRAFPISPRLAAILRKRIAKRGKDKPLFDRIWNFSRKFRMVLERLGMDLTLTPYTMRHSSIIRQIRAGTPLRIIAFGHDTSVREIERVYARYLNDAADDLRKGMLTETEHETVDNVVKLR